MTSTVSEPGTARSPGLSYQDLLDMDTREVPVVRFYPDGSCDRFRVQIRSGTSAPQVIAVDPWTCAPLLPSTGK